MFLSQRASGLVFFLLLLLLSRGVPALAQESLAKDMLKEPIAKAPSTHKRALVIGIDRYHNIRSLTTAQKDARDVAAFLRDSWGFGESITLITDTNEPSGSKLKKSLRAFTGSLKGGEQVVVFFSGHGVTIDGQEYLVPLDGDVDDIPNSCISYTKLSLELQSKKLARCLLITDACRNMAMPNSKADVRSNFGAGARDAQAPAQRHREFAELRSCEAGQKSLERADGAGGAFTFYMLQALKGEREAAPGGVLTFETLRDYVERKTSAYAAQNGEEQMPFGVSTYGQMVLASFDGTALQLPRSSPAAPLPARPAPMPAAPMPAAPLPVAPSGVGTAKRALPLRETVAAAWALGVQPPASAHANPPGAIAFSPDGTTLASGSWKKGGAAQVSEIILWNADLVRARQTMEGRWQSEWKGKGPRPPWMGHWGKVNALVFSPDNKALASGGEDGRVTLWSVQNGQPLRALDKAERPVAALCWTSSETLAGLTRDGMVLLWNRSSGKREKSLRLSNSGSGDWVRGCAFSRDGARLATSDSSGSINVWEIPTGRSLRKFLNSRYQDLNFPMGVEASVVAFSPDAQWLISANYSHIYINRIEKGTGPEPPSAKLYSANQRVSQLVFAPDGRSVAAVCEKSIFLLDPQAKNEAEAKLGELEQGGSSVRALSFSPRQTLIAGSADNGSVVFWK